MRRYNLVSGILLILLFTGFALAAPVLVQEDRQTGVDAVHIPRDVITMLEKRVGEGEGLEKLADDFFETGGKPVDSSDSHASSSSAPSSSAPPVPDRGSTNVAQAPAPAPNPVSSTANSDYQLLELSAPGSGSNLDWNHWRNNPNLPAPTRPAPSKPSTKYGLNLKTFMNKLNFKDPSPNSKPSTGSGFNWKQSLNPLNFMDPLTPQAKQALSKSSNPKPSTESAPNWKHWVNPLNLMDPLTPDARQALSKPSKPSTEWDLGWESWDYAHDVKIPPPSGSSSLKSSNPGTSNPGRPDPMTPQPLRPLRIVESPQEPENAVAPGPSPTPELTNPAESQPADPEAAAAALYAAKGKAKETRHISRSARDVGDATEEVATC